VAFPLSDVVNSTSAYRQPCGLYEGANPLRAAYTRPPRSWELWESTLPLRAALLGTLSPHLGRVFPVYVVLPGPFTRSWKKNLEPNRRSARPVDQQPFELPNTTLPMRFGLRPTVPCYATTGRFVTSSCRPHWIAALVLRTWTLDPTPYLYSLVKLHGAGDCGLHSQPPSATAFPSQRDPLDLTPYIPVLPGTPLLAAVGGACLPRPLLAGFC
jgi:hypothetical protein